MTAAFNKPVTVIRGGRMDTANDDEVDYEITDPGRLLGSNVNSIPIQNAVQPPRLFYGARFFKQAVPLVHREAALVRNRNMTTGRSYDFELGRQAGALFSDVSGKVTRVDPDEMEIVQDDGKKKVLDLYNNFPYNRMTRIHHFPKVKKGDAVVPGQLLASTNYTDDEGRLALGYNARIGLVAHKGYGMDDSIEISSSLAQKLTSDHMLTFEQDDDDVIKRGKNHFIALFPQTFTRGQLEKLDPDGVVVPGAVLQPGDPVVIQTKARSYSSSQADLSRLSKAKRFVRRDASQIWEGDDPAEVVDVVKNRGGIKVLLKYASPARPGDKIVLRAGGKGTVARVIPDEVMPRTEDGEPLEMLVNPLSLPSRVNASTFYELLFGKIARKKGKSYTLDSFPKDGSNWIEFVQKELQEAGLTDAERVFDPEEGRYLENPVTVGVANVLKLQHLSSKKLSQRGQGSYDLNRQPAKGGEGSQHAQRFSGLEIAVTLSSGANKLLAENINLRGELNEDFWRAMRQNRNPARPGRPFVWDKFRVLLNGAGVEAKDKGKGILRLVPMTDRELERRGSRPVLKGGTVNLRTLEPIPGGLFDPSLVRNQAWGHVDLPFEMVNPAYEDMIRTLLGLTKKEFDVLLHAQTGVQYP